MLTLPQGQAQTRQLCSALRHQHAASPSAPAPKAPPLTACSARPAPPRPPPNFLLSVVNSVQPREPF